MSVLLHFHCGTMAVTSKLQLISSSHVLDYRQRLDIKVDVKMLPSSGEQGELHFTDVLSESVGTVSIALYPLRDVHSETKMENIEV